MFLQLLHFFDQSLGPTVHRGLEAAILGWVWPYAHCVGNVWLTVFVCDDVGRTNFAGQEWQAAVLDLLVGRSELQDASVDGF